MTARIALTVLLLATVATAQTTRPMTRSTGHWNYPGDRDVPDKGPYLAFTPADWDGKTALPMLIFLHGAGYRGQDITKLEAEFLVQQIAGGKAFDAIVLFPQVSTYWRGEQGAAFVDHAVATYAGRFDPDRLYLMGESAGGGGCWEAAKLRAPLLAAAVPIATTIGRAEGADKLVGLPVWAFPNVHDPYQLVGKSRTQVEAVRAAGGKHVVLTEYTATPGKQNAKGQWPNTHRHAWETALADPGLWEWLWRQRRGRPELSLDPPPATRRAG